MEKMNYEKFRIEFMKEVQKIEYNSFHTIESCAIFRRDFEDICSRLLKKYLPMWPELAQQVSPYVTLCNMLKQDSCFKKTLLGWRVVKVPESVKNELEKMNYEKFRIELMKEVQKIEYNSSHTIESCAILRRDFEDIFLRLLKKYLPMWPELAQQFSPYLTLCNMLKQDSCFKETALGWRVVKVPESVKKELEKNELEKKHNIIVNYMKGNILPIISNFASDMITIATKAIIIGTPICAVTGGVMGGLALNSIDENYYNSNVVYNDTEFPMRDIYIVYNVDSVYFCNRRIIKITEVKRVGARSDYYYRDEIHDYYDMRTGEKICQDHEDGFYIEELLDFYDRFHMRSKNFNIELEEVVNDINLDFLLSREAKIKRK